MKLSPSLLTLIALSILALPAGGHLPSQDAKPSYDLHFYVLAPDDSVDGKPPVIKRIGSAVFTRSTKEDEVRKVLTLNLKIRDKVATIVIDTTSKKDGTPIKKTFVQNGTDGGTTTAFFTATGVDVYKPASVGTQPGKLSFPAPPGAVVADPTETWFSQSKPVIGTKVTYANFNVQALAWEETTAVYIEDVDKKFGKKTYTSHHLRLSAGSGSLDEFVDDHGDPVLIDQGSLQIERSEE